MYVSPEGRSLLPMMPAGAACCLVDSLTHGPFGSYRAGQVKFRPRAIAPALLRIGRRSHPTLSNWTTGFFAKVLALTLESILCVAVIGWRLFGFDAGGSGIRLLEIRFQSLDCGQVSRAYTVLRKVQSLLQDFNLIREVLYPRTNYYSKNTYK